jgi:hypothetical protein
MSLPRAVLAVTLMMTPAVAGCAAHDGDPPPAPRWESCQREQPQSAGVDAGDLPRLTDDFAAVAAVVCGADSRRRPDGSEHLIGTQDRSAEVAALVAALRLPDEPRTRQPCADDNPTVAFFVLLDAEGRWVRPGVPRDACGKQRAEVRTAVGTLALTRVSTWPIRQLRSAEAAAAGCSQQFTNDVAVYARSGGWAKTVSRLFRAGSRVRLCVYRVPESARHGDSPTGDFSAGRLLSAGQGAAVDEAVRRAPRGDAACAEPTGRFAVLRDTAGGEAVFVELDGCRRVTVTPLNDAPSLQQATAEVLGLLSAR